MVFENWALGRMFGPKSDEVMAGCRQLNNEELHNFSSSPFIIRMNKSSRMRWVRHVGQMGAR
jgi:hypothetical protein